MHGHFGSGFSLYSALGERKYLNEAERARFIATALCAPRAEVRTLCLTIAYTGCRLSEALSLTGQLIQIESGVIAFRTLKKRQKLFVREIPAPSSLLSDLCKTHIRQLQPRDRLWTFCRSQAWRLIKQVMRDANIGAGLHASPKGLRHGFGIHAVRCGVPLNLIQRWLGHASLTTTAVYLEAMGAEERIIAERMW